MTCYKTQYHISEVILRFIRIKISSYTIYVIRFDDKSFTSTYCEYTK